MKAFAAFEPKGELKPFEYDPGELKTHEVEIDVHYSGICHSDLSVIDNEWGMTQYPVVPGHEVIGKIAKVGDHVKHLTVNQLVQECINNYHQNCSKNIVIPACLSSPFSLGRRLG